jgi:hypothetical protein
LPDRDSKSILATLERGAAVTLAARLARLDHRRAT